MFAPSIAFVDLETTGMTAAADRITEVGVVRVDGGAQVQEWSTLVNPECSIPGAIQAMTGITNAVNLHHEGKYPNLQTVAPGAKWTESFWIRANGV